MGDGPPAWVVDARDAARLAALEDELAQRYDALRSTAPDEETAWVLERLASAARSRAQVFSEAASHAGWDHGRDLLRAFTDALCRFEVAAAEASGQGDAEMDAFHEEVARVARWMDVVQVVGGRDARD